METLHNPQFDSDYQHDFGAHKWGKMNSLLPATSSRISWPLKRFTVDRSCSPGIHMTPSVSMSFEKDDRSGVLLKLKIDKQTNKKNNSKACVWGILQQRMDLVIVMYP